MQPEGTTYPAVWGCLLSEFERGIGSARSRHSGVVHLHRLVTLILKTSSTRRTLNASLFKKRGYFQSSINKLTQ